MVTAISIHAAGAQQALGHQQATSPQQAVGLVQQFVESTSQLYSLPAAAAEVLRLTGEPTINLRAIKECVESDPALAARILRVANSSLFGPSRQVTDLSQALTLLGIRPLKILVLGFSLPKELFAGQQAEVLTWYWRHTLVKAVAARELAERLWHLPGDEPFLAGLVQDIGILALIQQLGEPYHRLLSHVQSHGGSLLAGELETLGFDHLVLSARLLAHWGLPPGLCAAISVPPDVDRITALSSRERSLPQMLHLAELLSRLLAQPYGSALHDLLHAGSHYCGLTYDGLQSLVTSLQAKVQDLAEVLSLELPGGQSYVDMLLAAHARLADETLLAAAAAQELELGHLAGELQRELATATRRPSQVSTKPDTSGSPVSCGSQSGTGSPPRQTTAPTLGASTSSYPSNLLSRLAAALESARQKRVPVSLILLEIDRFSDVLMQLGVGGAAEVLRLLHGAISDWTGPGVQTLVASDSRVVLVARDHSRQAAVQLARQVQASVRSWSRQKLPLSFEMTLSGGLATLEVPPRNYPPGDMLAAAARCLSAAQLSGGNTVKSIDV